LGEGGADWAELDVGVGDGSSWVGLLDSCGNTCSWVTRTTGNTWCGGSGGRWVGGIEPVHGNSRVVPDGHNQDHTTEHSLTHLSKATLGVEYVGISESSLLGVTPSLGDGVTGDTGDGGLGVGDGYTVLDVEAVDG